jgi:hypothetical protein
MRDAYELASSLGDEGTLKSMLEIRIEGIQRDERVYDSVAEFVEFVFLVFGIRGWLLCLD